MHINNSTWAFYSLPGITYVNTVFCHIHCAPTFLAQTFRKKFFHLKIFKRFYLFIFREGKGGRKRGTKTSMCACLSRAPYRGTWPTTQACALTGNWTSNPLVQRLALNPLSHTSQGNNCSNFLIQFFIYLYLETNPLSYSRVLFCIQISLLLSKVTLLMHKHK